MRPDLSYYLRRLRETPAHELPARAVRFVARLLREQMADRRDRQHAGYARDRNLPRHLNQMLPTLDAKAIAGRAGPLEFMADQTAAGYFDLLGSGWVAAHRTAAAPGFEGQLYPLPENAGIAAADETAESERHESRRLWRLLGTGYAALDWHRDLRSGFRWPPAAWCRDIRYADRAGADVKSPWELGRLQHFPLLALAAATATDDAQRRRYREALRNQLIDFMASNPPGVGVQWVCAMDVSIRAANLLLAVDLLKAFGMPFEPEIEALMARSAIEHARHIVTHVEWQPGLRANHYLCNLGGLAFCAVYLPESDETDAWLAYAAANLLAEAEIQFDEQGCGFEASTSYHRLSSETLIYATAVLATVPAARWRRIGTTPPPLLDNVPGWQLAMATRLTDWAIGLPAILSRRIAGAAATTAALMTIDGRVPQFGDNDSGRFFKLEPALAADGRREDGRDHRHLLAAAAGLLGRGDLAALAAPFTLDATIVVGLSSRAVPPPAQPVARAGFESFPGLGLYVWRHPRFVLFVRCGSNGQNGNGGHAHNDQLSFELWVDGQPLLVDPGTYVYTPAPAWRNRFRSTSWHNTLWVDGREQNRNHPETLFALLDDAHGRVLDVSAGSFLGQHDGFGVPHRRQITVADMSISIRDECALPDAKGIALTLAEGAVVAENAGGRVLIRNGRAAVVVQAGATTWQESEAFYSAGYGLRSPIRRLAAGFAGPVLDWQIAIPPLA